MAVLSSQALLGPVGADNGTRFSFIPLPAFDTDPNSGETYGLLPVVLLRDQKDEIRGILAPSVTYNQFRGVTGTFRYFGYPTATERVDLIAGYSTKIEREFELRYRNSGVFAGRFHADLQLLYDRDSTARFFGLGAESSDANETNMTLTEAGFSAELGVNLTPTARLSFGETLKQYGVGPGGVPGLPYTADVYPALPGIRGATVHAQRIALGYDNRDSTATPTRGLSLGVYAEASAELFGSASDYLKSGADATYLIPFWDNRVVLAVRGLLEALAGDSDTPFEVLPTLGGSTTLRGFPTNRFYGNGRILLNLETRIRLLRLRMFGVTPEFQAAPFVDIGKVFNSLEELFEGRLEVTPGVGLRGLVAPTVVGKVEVGVSREGVAIYAGLDYPF